MRSPGLGLRLRLNLVQSIPQFVLQVESLVNCRIAFTFLTTSSTENSPQTVLFRFLTVFPEDSSS